MGKTDHRRLGEVYRRIGGREVGKETGREGGSCCMIAEGEFVIVQVEHEGRKEEGRKGGREGKSLHHLSQKPLQKYFKWYHHVSFSKCPISRDR